MDTTQPSYIEVANALQKTPGKYNASQIHGLLCGLICASSDDKPVAWESIIFGEKKNKEAVEVLQRLYDDTYKQLHEFSFEFTLLLPDDESDINQRAEALGLWCQGFLTGLEQSKAPIQNRPSTEVTETLNDLIEISQVNYGDIADDEEDESAYFELVEYVRMAALMIFHELKSGNISHYSTENNQLH